MKDKRVMIWCGDAANQKALANKIAKQFNLCGIVLDKKRNIRKQSFLKRVVPALQDRIFFRPVIQAWTRLLQQYAKQYPQWPESALLSADSINSEEAFRFTQDLSPDLIIVSGTALVKSKMLSLKPSIGIINLHTGLSPYIKGGPNCTNWCIATGEYEKIGNTIMWINEGIDAGNIITSEATALTAARDLYDVQWQVMEHAHDLYLKAIGYLLKTPAPHNSVPQKQIAPGKLYLTRMWNFAAKRKLLANLPGLLAGKRDAKRPDIITVSIKAN